MELMVDVLEIKQLEAKHGFKCSREDIETARYNEGKFVKIHEGKVIYCKVQLLRFPHDFLHIEQEAIIAKDFFYDE